MSKLLDLKKLCSFLKVADTCSFAQAAELLNYSPAALTIQIQSLEKDLGVTLFDRLGKRIYLTNAGVQLYEYARELIYLNDEAIHAFESTDQPLQGHLRIGTIASLSSCLFPQLLHLFHATHPQASVSVVTDTPTVLYKKLAYNNLDLVVALDEPLASPGLNTVLSLPTSVVACVSKDHPLASVKEIDLDTLLEYPCILTEKGASYRQILEQALAKTGRMIQPIIETDNVDLIFSLLRYSKEFSVLPSIFLTKESQGRGLVPLCTPELDLSIQMQVFFNKNKYISREMEAFLSTVKTYIYQVFQMDPTANRSKGITPKQ